MDEYRRDAYAILLPGRGPSGETHGVVIDVIDNENLEVTHHVIALAMTVDDAKHDASLLNKWRGQTQFKQ